MKNMVTGVDIGGSHITAALIDLDAHSIITDSLVRRHVNAKGNAVEIIQSWTDAIIACNKIRSHSSIKIGIAMPGPFDYETGVCKVQGLDKFESLYNLNIKTLIAGQLSIEPTAIYMMNDASCFLKGELFGGAARGNERVIGITLGTGLGSAVYKDGTLHDGDLYYSAYNHATAEDYLSTRWFLNEYFTKTGITVNNVKELAKLVPADVNAANAFIIFGNNLGNVLSAYVTRHQAGLVVIGGNIINAWELFMPETLKVLQSNGINIPIVKAQLGEEAALMGAGSLCSRAFQTTLFSNL